jgi:hypothetical protein
MSAGLISEIQSQLNEVELEEKRFELAQRKAKIYASSSLVPKEYQNIGNVLIAENMARRMGADVLMVMQNLYIVHGKPGWSAQFLIACFNSCHRFSAIKYRFSGDPDTPEYGCVAETTEIATGEVIQGTRITLAMAKAEGWSTKNGSKWQTMPEQMLRYRAATFLIRTTAPEIGMGLQTADEVIDGVGSVIDVQAEPYQETELLTESKGTEGLKSKLKAKSPPKETPPEPEVAQAETQVQAPSDDPKSAKEVIAVYRKRLAHTTKPKDLADLSDAIADDKRLSKEQKEVFYKDIEEALQIIESERAK